MRLFSLIFAGVVTSMIMGCSGGEDEWTKNLPETVPVSGIVLLDGQPVEGASIVFAPADGAKYPAKALTDRSGQFEVDAFPSKSGAVPGKYKVMISKTIETTDASLVAAKAPVAADSDAAVEGAAHAAGDTSGVHWVNSLPAKYANPNTSGLTADVPPGGTSDIKFELKS